MKSLKVFCIAIFLLTSVGMTHNAFAIVSCKVNGSIRSCITPLDGLGTSGHISINARKCSNGALPNWIVRISTPKANYVLAEGGGAAYKSFKYSAPKNSYAYLSVSMSKQCNSTVWHDLWDS